MIEAPYGTGFGSECPGEDAGPGRSVAESEVNRESRYKSKDEVFTLGGGRSRRDL